MYADAYIAQWKYFSALCSASISPVAGQKSPESKTDAEARLSSYSRTFTSLQDVLEALELPHDPYANSYAAAPPRKKLKVADA